jgi:hypothetical protein
VFPHGHFLTPLSEPDVQLSLHPALRESAFLIGIAVPNLSSIPFSVLLQTSPESLSGLSEYPIVDSLAPFPMWLAFPTSEYYGVSEALDSRLLVVRTLVDLHTLTFLQARPTFTKLDSNKII